MQQFLKDIRPLLYGRPIMYFDAGAFQGAVFSEVAAIDWGAFLEAHLIEPNPESFTMLRQAASAIEQNALAKQVHCHNVAVGSKKGSLQFRSEGTRTRVLKDGGDFDGSNGAEYFEAKTSTLDDIAGNWGVKHISILKIDVEGYEGEVLKGAENLLRVQSVDFIYAEAGMEPDGGHLFYYRLLEDLLRPFKYRLFKIYEQKNEWLTDSPFLRRVNLAFISERFATQHPYHLSKKLFDFQRKNKEIEGSLAVATGKLAATSSELIASRQEFETLLAESKNRNAKLQEKLEKAERNFELQVSELAANLAQYEASASEKVAEFESLRAAKQAAEESRDRRIAEYEARLTESEKSLAEEAAKCDSLRAAKLDVEESSDKRIAEYEVKSAEEKRKLAVVSAECERLEAALRLLDETRQSQITALEMKSAEEKRKFAVASDECERLEAALRLLDETRQSQIAALEIQLAESEKSLSEKNALCRNLELAIQAAEDGVRRLHIDIEALLSERKGQIARLQSELKRSMKALEKEKKQANIEKVRRRKNEQILVLRLEKKLKTQSDVLQAKTFALESQIQASKKTISFQLGSAILDALKSPAKALALPSALWQLHKDARNRLPHILVKDDMSSKGPRFQAMLTILRTSGVDALEEHFSSLNLSVASRVVALSTLAREVHASAPLLAIDVAREAQKLDPKPYRAKWLAFRLAEQGFLVEAAELLAGAEADGEQFSNSEQKRRKKIFASIAPQAAKPQDNAPPNEEPLREELKVHRNGGSEPVVCSPVGPQLPWREAVSEINSATHSRISVPDAVAEKKGRACVGGRLFTVEELGERLWAGHAKYVVPALNEIKTNIDVPAKDRAAAAWNLASWFYVECNFSRALEEISLLQAISKEPHPRALLTAARCLLHINRPEEAARLLDSALQSTKKIDFQLLKSTAVRQMMLLKEEPIERVDAAQLEEINRAYASVGMAPLVKRDPLLPLSFSNVMAPAEPKKVAQNHKVSVIIPAFNAQDSIAVAINSLTEQTWRNLEILVVDDCSSDATADVVSELAKNDPRIRLIRKTENAGAYAARNSALEYVTGDLITVHDSDDWSHSQKIEMQVKLLLSRDGNAAVLSHWVRVGEHLEIVGGWIPKGTVFDLNLSSLLFKKEVLQKLGRWDNVRVGGDSEFFYRLKSVFGAESVQKVSPKYVLSLSLSRKESLTNKAATHMKSMRYGVRWQYRDAYLYRILNQSRPGNSEANSEGVLVPRGNLSKSGAHRNHDVIVIADFTAEGDSFDMSLNYVVAACRAGKKVGIFHWPNFSASSSAAQDYARLWSRLGIPGEPTAPIRHCLYDVCVKYGVDLLTTGDSVETDLVLIGDPSLLQYLLDSFPEISAKEVVVIANAVAADETLHYDPETARSNLRTLFHKDGIWIATSMRLKRLLQKDLRYCGVLPVPWYPLIDVGAWCAAPLRWRGGESKVPFVGRNARNLRASWPASTESLKLAYGVGAPWRVLIRGEADEAIKRLGEIPANWTILSLEAMDGAQFLQELDFYVYFSHEEHQEEVCQRVLEAMAAGVPVILPRHFKENFSDAALYADPGDVATLISEYWRSEDRYLAQAEAGRKFVKIFCDLSSFEKRLAELPSAGGQRSDKVSPTKSAECVETK